MTSRMHIAALAAAVLATSMTFIDATALNQALPAIGEAIEASASQLLWVIGTYAAVLALLLLPAGVLADRVGRRATLATGIVVFAIASAMCAAAADATWLIGMRAMQGAGGAMMVAGSLAVLMGASPPSQRGRAIGAWSAWCAAATVAGPLLGGALAEAGMWRVIFCANLPLACIALICLGGVGENEIKAPHALTSRAPLWRLPAVRAAVVLTLVLDTALYGLLLVLPLALIAGAGYPANDSAAAQMALVLILVVVCPIAGRWVDRRGPRTPVCAGCLLAATGLLGLTIGGLGDGPSDYALRLLGPLSVIGAGMGLAIVGLSTTMMNGVGEHALGAGAALNALVARGASVIATALFGGLLLQRGVDLTSIADGSTPWHVTFRTAMALAAMLCATAGTVSVRVLPRLVATDAIAGKAGTHAMEAQP